MICTGQSSKVQNTLIEDLSNQRVMAVGENNLLKQVGGSVQFGKRQDLFWIAIAIIVSGVLVSISIFGKRKKRR